VGAEPRGEATRARAGEPSLARRQARGHAGSSTATRATPRHAPHACARPVPARFPGTAERVPARCGPGGLPRSPRAGRTLPSLSRHGRCGAWAAAALCCAQPGKRHPGLRGGGPAPHAIPSRPRAGPESSRVVRPPLPPRTAWGEANATSDPSVPHSSPATSAPSTLQLRTPPQQTPRSRELTPGHPGLSLPGCPCPPAPASRG